MIYWTDFSYIQPSEGEIRLLRFAVYVLASALTVMMGIVLQRVVQLRSIQTEASLKVSERDASILQTISDNMDEAIFRSSVIFGLVYVNEAFAKMYGYPSKEEMLKVDPVNLYQSKADRDLLLSRIEKFGRVSNMLMRYRKKDGSSFWGRLSSSRLVENGQVYLVGTIADVTVQQEQTELLLESEKQLRESQRLAKMGNWIMYPDEMRVDWSGECAKIHGFLPMDYSDSIGAWFDGVQDLDRSEITTGIERSSMMNKSFEFGTWFITPTGERKYLNYVCQQRMRDEKRVWTGTVQDQTELKDKEVELIATREFYQNVLDNIPVESVLVDDRGKYYYVSKNAIRDESLRTWLIGKDDHDYVKLRNKGEELGNERMKRVQEALQGDLTIRWEEKMKTADGRDTYHIRNLVPIKLLEKGVERKYLIGYSFDINDIKRAQFRLEDRNAELNQLNKELDRFVYSISHDLRAPIASVLGLNALAEEAEDAEDLENILIMQREALDRLDRYIRDVIDYSRNKRMDVRPELVDVKTLIDECLADLVYMNNYDRIDYFIEVPEGLTWFTDALRFRIIINNLLSNAIKYADESKEKSFISIRAQSDDKGLKLIVEDNGIGIPDEFKDQIWDIFFRGVSTVPGSGLGLYILRESVRNIQGDVRFESELGKGTTFHITLPSLRDLDED
jgi:PAS domain S-box-containing protein